MRSSAWRDESWGDCRRWPVTVMTWCVAEGRSTNEEWQLGKLKNAYSEFNYMYVEFDDVVFNSNELSETGLGKNRNGRQHTYHSSMSHRPTNQGLCPWKNLSVEMQTMDSCHFSWNKQVTEGVNLSQLRTKIRNLFYSIPFCLQTADRTQYRMKFLKILTFSAPVGRKFSLF